MFRLKSLTCPVSKQPIVSPVMAADGYTYDFEMIKKALSSTNKSPVTGVEFPHKGVIAHKTLADLIKEMDAINSHTSIADEVSLVEAGRIPQLSSLYCPLTKKLFINPVLAADEYTYEKEALLELLSIHGNSPHTGQAFPHKQFLQDLTMQQVVAEYQALQRKARESKNALTTADDATFFSASTPVTATTQAPPLPPSTPVSKPIHVFLSQTKLEKWTALPSDAARQAFLTDHIRTINMQKAVIISKLQRQEISSLAEYFTQIENIELENIALGFIGARLLTTALSGSAYLNIKILNLLACHIGPDGMLMLTTALPHLTQLEHLLLDHNEIGDSGAEKLAQSLPALQTLLGISVQHNGIETRGAIALILAGQTIHAQRPTVKFNLNVANNPFDPRAIQAKLNELKAEEATTATARLKT